MRVAEIQRHRELHEAITSLEIQKSQLNVESHTRHNEAYGVTHDHADRLFELSRKDQRGLVALYLAEMNATHKMMQRLMVAPSGESLGTVKQRWPYPHFSMKERTIRTPDAGLFVAEARIWRNHRITSADTSLSLKYLHPMGPYSSEPDIGSRETIVTTQLDELTFDKLSHISWTEPVLAAGMRETVATVCEQVGVEVVEVLSPSDEL